MPTTSAGTASLTPSVTTAPAIRATLSTATVNLTINNINDAPVAVDDTPTVAEDTSNNAIDVLANDTDADNLTPPFNAGLTVIAVGTASHGR